MNVNDEGTAIAPATYLTEHGRALCARHRNSPTWAGQTMAVRGHPRYDIGRIVLGTDVEITCADCLAETASIVAGTPVVLRIWNGADFAIMEGTVEAVEASNDFPGDPAERVVILAEDDANAYRAGDIVSLGAR